MSGNEYAMVEAVYNSGIGFPATYIDNSGAESPLRVLRIRDTEDLLQAGDLAARGVRVALRDREEPARRVPLPLLEAGDEPGRNAGDRWTIWPASTWTTG